MRVLKLLKKTKPCPVLLRQVGQPSSLPLYCDNVALAAMEIADLEAMRENQAFGDLRHCHVVSIDVVEVRMLVITWDWGK